MHGACCSSQHRSLHPSGFANICAEADLGGDDDDNDNADDANDEAADFTVGDTISKSLALVKQVSTVQYM